MATLVIRKSTLYIIGIVILIALGIYFVSNNSAISNTSSTIGGGAVQEITLSFKNGNYYPNTVNVEVNKTVRIYLDASVRGCYRSFTIRSFGVAKNLKTPSDYVEFIPDKEGTFGFACSMGMGTGKLVVGNGGVNVEPEKSIISGNAIDSNQGGCSMGTNGGGCGCGG